ncbi:hypothetical protein [Jiangella ureilytica]|uniref:hypothetical protein n=1 Tax=Jiangella ureilytica TaxID=2530374 RepID=UPI0013A5D987|nr:hypothetical protein [Jiangella ureilytica]
MPFGNQVPPECEDEYEAAMHEAEETGSTTVAFMCERGGPETEQPTVVWTPPGE